MRLIAIAAGTLTLLTAGLAVAQTTPAAPPAHVTAAVADTSRPQADRARDAARHPAEVLAFAGVRPGDKVADFVMGGGYFTRLLSAAVGPTGRVFAYQPAEFIGFQASYGQQQTDTVAALSNATAVTTPFGEVAFAEPLDLIFTAQNYHDLHLRPFPADLASRVNRALFNALKPGGVLVVIDHYAADGSGLRDAHTLHRIDRQAVIDELTAAGFVLDGQSDLLRNPQDPRTANVFDESIRGRTDQFMLRFRRPR